MGPFPESVAADSGFVDTIVTDSFCRRHARCRRISVRGHNGKSGAVGGGSVGKRNGLRYVVDISPAHFLLFTIGALRVKNSPRHFHAIWSDLFETRLRSNAFDDTVDETMLLRSSTASGCRAAGVLLWAFIGITAGDNPAWSMSVTLPQPVGIAVCDGRLCHICGRNHSRILGGGKCLHRFPPGGALDQGSGGSTAIGGVLILPPAFLVLCYPAWTPTLLIIAASAFVLCKILFICKGFRIFSIICPHGCFFVLPLQSGNSTFDSGLHRGP